MNIAMEFLLLPSKKKSGLYLAFNNAFERDTFYDSMWAIVEKNEESVGSGDHSIIEHT
jgi:hypothetical protein